jgi:glycerol-3-phosphate O-acyltransferase/dihydroxyacetone phosphate acyltransferase
MRALLLALIRFAVHTFYRVTLLGGRVPEGGPVVLVSNHPNALVDPAVLLEATPRQVHFVGKEPLLRMPVLGWVIGRIGLIPVYRAQDGADTQQNQDAFRAVRAVLERGEVIALFPEGKSHDEPAVQRLKTGAARMALSLDPARAGEVRVVPVGLVYGRKGRFRSRVALWIGEPVDPADLRELAARDPWAAAQAFHERIGQSLERVTVNLDQWEDWPLLRLAERLWKPARGASRIARLGELAAAARRLRQEHPEQMQRLALRIRAFRHTMQELGLAADHLGVRYEPRTVLRFVLRHGAAAVLGLPFVALAFAYWLPPYLLVKFLVPRLKPKGDLEATYKVLGSALFFTLWWLATALWLGSAQGWIAALALLVLAPLAGRLALSLAEDHLEAWRQVRGFARHVTASELRTALVTERDAIAAEIEALARRPAQN